MTYKKKLFINNTSYTSIFHIDKILLILNCFSSNSNRNVTELVVDIKKINTKNNKLKCNN